jgi:hypothetical protein
VGTGFTDEYAQMLKASLEGPLKFEGDEEFAKQRKGNDFSCPNCGWGPTS